jgi:hypothetical protein
MQIAEIIDLFPVSQDIGDGCDVRIRCFLRPEEVPGGRQVRGHSIDASVLAVA